VITSATATPKPNFGANPSTGDIVFEEVKYNNFFIYTLFFGNLYTYRSDRWANFRNFLHYIDGYNAFIL